MEILPSDERLQASEPFQPSLINHCQGHRKGPSKLPSPVTGGARHPLPPERGQEQSPQAPHPPWTGMTAPSEGPGTAPAPSPRQLAARRFAPGSPPARWQMDRRPPGVRAGKRHQHQNQRDVGWSRRCSDCGGQTQLGHNVSPAPLSLSAQGSQQGASSLKWGSLRHPKSSVGTLGGCGDAAAWQELVHAAAAFRPCGHNGGPAHPGTSLSLAGARALPASFALLSQHNHLAELLADSQCSTSPGNSQHRFGVILSSVL